MDGVAVGAVRFRCAWHPDVRGYSGSKNQIASLLAFQYSGIFSEVPNPSIHEALLPAFFQEIGPIGPAGLT